MNILLITRQCRRVAQAALELCRSLERRDLVTFISSMSLNAERVACHTPTPWKSRQHKLWFRLTGSARQANCRPPLRRAFFGFSSRRFEVVELGVELQRSSWDVSSLFWRVDA
jgi:hypothetical protein